VGDHDPPPAALLVNAGRAVSQLPVVESRVWPMAWWSWRVARVASSNFFAHQPHLPVHEHAAAVGDGHAGRLLTAVLERVEPVEHEGGDRSPRRPAPEDPAYLARMVDT
jgi:hypothetical protein